MKPSKLVTMLTDFHAGKQIKSTATYRPEHNYKLIKKVWNEGRGLIQWAAIAEDNTLLINAVHCTNAQIKEIVNGLTVKYEFVFLGYPDYYTNGLQSIRGKYKPEQWGKKIPAKV